MALSAVAPPVPWRRRADTVFGEPSDPVHELAVEDLTQSPRLAHGHALANDWQVTLLGFSSGVPDKDGRPKRTIVKELRYNEDGSPMMTAKGNQKTRQVPGPPVQTRTTHLRAYRVWEREHLIVCMVWHDDAAGNAWVLGSVRGFAGVNHTTALALIKRSGAPE